jgi:hypothetical protein
MKTLVISFMLSLTALIINAQEVTVLDETRLFYAPVNAQVVQDGDNYTYKVREDQGRQFARDPIAFMKANFNIQNFIGHTAHKNYHAYMVTFKSTDGALIAHFDRNGKLLQTRQQFKNVVLPSNIRNNMHNTYKGWVLTKAKYTARTKGEILAKAVYKVRLENGSEKENLKIDARDRGIGVAVN